MGVTVEIIDDRDLLPRPLAAGALSLETAPPSVHRIVLLREIMITKQGEGHIAQEACESFVRHHRSRLEVGPEHRIRGRPDGDLPR